MLGNLLKQILEPYTIGLFLFIFLLSLWFFRSRQLAKYNLPPSPRPLPIVGNLLYFARSKERLHELLYQMSKDPKYGKVFTIFLGSKPCIVLNHIDVIKEATHTRANDFANRPDVLSGRILSNDGKSIVFGKYHDPVWKFQRKVAHHALRKFAAKDHLQEAAYKSMDKIATLIDKENEQPFNIRPCLELLVFNLMCQVLIGKDFEFDDPEFTQFRSVTKDFLLAIGDGLLADFFPALAVVPTSGKRIMTNLMTNFYDFFEKYMEEHKRDYDPENLQDMMDYLLHCLEDVEQDERSMKEAVTETHLILIMIDLLGASLDTLVTTIHCAVAFAVMNPDKTAKMVAELDRVLGPNRPSNANYRELKYTESFVKETLRKGTLAVLGVPLATTCDTKIDRYDVPKGSMVLINIWSVHNDTENWVRPWEFHPERFLEDNEEGKKLVLKPESYMPFSEGRRKCLGEALAKSQLMLLLPLLFKTFEFKAPPGKKLQLEYENANLANLPKPYDVVARRRNQ